MSIIKTYEIFRKIPDVSDEQAQDAADSLAHVSDVATKSDIANLKSELTWRMVIIAGIIIAAISVIVKF